MAEHFVYVHRRADSGLPFYVGKGKRSRATCEQHRTAFWRRVADKAGGYSVAYVARSLPEELAFLVEIECIARLRSLGVRLCNMTDGGEGTTGYRWDKAAALARASKLKGIKRPDVSARLKGVPKTEAHRKSLSESKIGIKASQATKEKMSATRKGRVSAMLGKRHRPESIAKIKAALVGEANPFFGKKHSPEVVEKIRLANIGRKDSEETRARKSAARMGEKNMYFGKPVPEERKAKQVASLKAFNAANRMTCPHCSRVTDPSNAVRWHFANCKGRK